MSTSVTVLVRGPSSVIDIVQYFAKQLGIVLEKRAGEAGEIHQTVLFGVSIDAFDDHGFVDDRDIPFSAFRFAVSFTRPVSTEAELKRELCRVMALIFASEFSRFSSSDCLVVEDLQRVIGSYGRDQHRT